MALPLIGKPSFARDEDKERMDVDVDGLMGKGQENEATPDSC